MSKTPITDANAFFCAGEYAGGFEPVVGGCHVVPREVAERLERSLDEWKAEVEKLRGEVEEQRARMAQLDTLRLETEAGLIHRARVKENALRTIHGDFLRHGRSISNHSDGEYTQDYTTRGELVERAINT